MNRAVKHLLSKTNKYGFGQLVIQAIRRAPEVYEINKKFHNKKDDSIADPYELAKYAARIYPWLKINGKKVSLKKMQEIKDPYEIVTFWAFNGQFSPNTQLGGFAPVGTDIKKTKWFKPLYQQMDDALILAKWKKLRKSLVMEDLSPSKLIYTFNNSHVYFMQRADNSLIKIGHSIHPGLRKKQIEYGIGNKLKILHIISSGGPDLERKLHNKFDSVRVHGEWFKPVDELLEYIEEAKESGME